MDSSSSSSLNFLFSLILLSVLPFLSHSSDPDPLQDFCVADLNSALSINGFPCMPASEVTSDDFFYGGLMEEANTNNSTSGAAVTAANVFAFPAVNTLGISMNRVDFAYGGLNTPHSHPRATEAGVIIKGKLLVGFLTTKNVLYSKVLTPGMMFVIPRGLVHFQMNVGEGKAQIFTAFNSHFPGAVIIPPALFGSKPCIPNQVLTKAFQVDDAVINTIKSKFTS